MSDIKLNSREGCPVLSLSTNSIPDIIVIQQFIQEKLHFHEKYMRANFWLNKIKLMRCIDFYKYSKTKFSHLKQTIKVKIYYITYMYMYFMYKMFRNFILHSHQNSLYLLAAKSFPIII